MTDTWDNEHCRIAARMLDSNPALLDSRLIEYLNELDNLIKAADGGALGGALGSRQVIALAIMQWQHDKADDFTKSKTK